MGLLNFANDCKVCRNGRSFRFVKFSACMSTNKSIFFAFNNFCVCLDCQILIILTVLTVYLVNDVRKMKRKRSVETLFLAFNFARNFRSSVEKIEGKKRIRANNHFCECILIKYESFGAETVAK